MLKKYMLQLLFAVIFTLDCQYKIVYLISPPRSLSVAFLRMMQARGDFTIFHEPSQNLYNQLYSPSFVNQWFKKDTPDNFQEIKQKIFNKAEYSNVFVKEMSFALKEFLDEELIKNPHTYFIFLLRNPHHTTISFWKKQNNAPFGQHSFSELVGYKAAYKLFLAIKEHSLHAPKIIFAEDLYCHPENTIRAFCNYVGIPFMQHALSWDNLGHDFDGQPWHEIKHREVFQHWHSEAIESTGFAQPSLYEVDEKGNPTFAEITDPEHQIICQQAYEENLVYYNKLLQYQNYFLSN